MHDTNVISIGKVVSASAAVRYFEEAVADSRHADYLARDATPTLWRGAAAAALGLDGRVEHDALVRVLDGRHPVTGDDLGRRFATRKNVAFDVTYSVPKSVSLLYALCDAPIRRAVLDALDAGAVAAHGYLERHAAWGRATAPPHKRVMAVRAELLTASFTHRTARPVTRGGTTTVDPQLHVHLLVASTIRRADGSWGQLWGPPLYAHAAAAGAIGQAATRDVLVRRLGVRVRTNPNGTFEVEGFTPEQLAEFSQRHRQALAAAAAVGANGLHGTKVAVLDSREAKAEPEATTALVATWRERAAAVDLTSQHIAALVDQEQMRGLRWFDVQTVEEIVGRGEGGLTAQASVFTRRDLVRSLAAHAPLGMQPDAIEHLADAILAEPSAVVPMVPEHGPDISPKDAVRGWVERGMEVHYSTPEVVGLERRALESAQRRQAVGGTVLPAAAVTHAVETSGRQLTDGQCAMVSAVCTSPAGVVVIEGAAGTGKTTAARVVRDVCTAHDVPIVGCAVSGRATVELQKQADIPSFTTASLLYQLTTMGRHLSPGGLVVADECSMMGPDLAQLLLVAERDRAKLVMIGDSQQHQPINGGCLFRSIGHAIGRTELTEVIRQHEAWDREVIMALRLGDAAPLVRRYLEDGRIHTQPDETTRVATMAADWLAATRDGHDVITVARERHVVAALNAVMRAAAVDASLVACTGVRRACVDHLGHKPVDLGELDFAVGDRVLIVGRNKRRQGLHKGLRGTVRCATTDGTLVLEVRGGGDVTVPPDYTGITHGYALTAHRAQGATADLVLVHGADAAHRQWFYVALSRHRVRATYYDVEPVRNLDGVHHDDGGEERSIEKRLEHAMSRDGAKPTTLDYPQEYDRQLVHAHAIDAPHGDATGGPTGKQLAMLRDHGGISDLPRVATWIHASLLIDSLDGTPRGADARRRLIENGVEPHVADRIIMLAEHDLGSVRRTSLVGLGHRPTGKVAVSVSPATDDARTERIDRRWPTTPDVHRNRVSPRDRIP